MASVLLSPVTGGLAAFKAFLKSEYSEENIDFWVSCEEYKKIKSPSKRTPQAQEIYREFISVQAAREVGLCGVPSRRSRGGCETVRVHGTDLAVEAVTVTWATPCVSQGKSSVIQGTQVPPE